MTPKPPKPDTKAASSWITGGREELKNQSPAQRGIHPQAVAEPAPAGKPKAAPTRKRFTVNLEIDLIEEARRMVANSLGLTLTGLVEEALRKELAKREREAGGAIPRTASAPKKGRPVVLKKG